MSAPPRPRVLISTWASGPSSLSFRSPLPSGCPSHSAYQTLRGPASSSMCSSRSLTHASPQKYNTRPGVRIAPRRNTHCTCPQVSSCSAVLSASVSAMLVAMTKYCKSAIRTAGETGLSRWRRRVEKRRASKRRSRRRPRRQKLAWSHHAWSHEGSSSHDGGGGRVCSGDVGRDGGSGTRSLPVSQ